MNTNELFEKLKTGTWFLQRPRYWAYAAALAARKFREDRDRPELSRQAGVWAQQRAVPVQDALTAVALFDREQGVLPSIADDLLAEANELAQRSSVQMGRAGDTDLIYAAVILSGSTRAVETGVAYGWSSLAILAALENLGKGRLISVDMPYPKIGNDEFVGIVVPARLRKRWTLVREPDRYGVSKAIRSIGGAIDFCHYDSDKSYWGRRFGYRALWGALRPGGVFISDDIQDNLAFREFVEALGARFSVTQCQSKYVGILRKPPA